MNAIQSHDSPFKTLDVMVLAQGTVIYERGEFQMEGFQRVIDVNLNSLMACSIKYRSMLAASRGSIIAIGSTAAFQATVGNPAYNASKAGVVGLTRTLATAWAKEGIRVNSIAPGLVDTKLTKVTTDNPRRRQAALQRIPMGRLGTPQDIAGAALFLASPLAGYIIGQTLPVDGGLVLA
jgi:3-oxoacyl-[acyl-carrier protein] reductase